MWQEQFAVHLSALLFCVCVCMCVCVYVCVCVCYARWLFAFQSVVFYLREKRGRQIWDIMLQRLVGFHS